MAQRKAKEQLLAEIPKPRLSDEELMELFYSKKEKNPQDVKNPSTARDTEVAVISGSGGSLEEAKKESEPLVRDEQDSVKWPSTTSSYNKPTHMEGSLEKPTYTEPLNFSRDGSGRIDFRREESSEHKEALTTIGTTALEKLEVSQTSKLLGLNKNEGGLHKAGQKEQLGEKPYDREPFSQEPLQTLQSRPETGTAFSIERALNETFRLAFEILPTLGPLEQLLYLWFLNLSHAVGR